jgi:hypothetical protein
MAPRLRESNVLVLIASTWSDKAFGLIAAGLWFAAIFAMLAAAVTLARRYREHGSILRRLHDNTTQDEDDPGALLTKFRDLHSRGTLSDGEYRTIRAKLATEIQADLDGDDRSLSD